MTRVHTRHQTTRHNSRPYAQDPRVDRLWTKWALRWTRCPWSQDLGPIVPKTWPGDFTRDLNKLFWHWAQDLGLEAKGLENDRDRREALSLIQKSSKPD